MLRLNFIAMVKICRSEVACMSPTSGKLSAMPPSLQGLQAACGQGDAVAAAAAATKCTTAGAHAVGGLSGTAARSREFGVAAWFDLICV